MGEPADEIAAANQAADFDFANGAVGEGGFRDGGGRAGSAGAFLGSNPTNPLQPGGSGQSTGSTGVSLGVGINGGGGPGQIVEGRIAPETLKHALQGRQQDLGIKRRPR